MIKSLFKYARIFIAKLASEDDFSEFEDKLFKTPENKIESIESSKIDFDIKRELGDFIESCLWIGQMTAKQPKRSYNFSFGANALPSGNAKTVLVIYEEDDSQKLKLAKKYINALNETEDLFDKEYIKLKQFIDEEKLINLRDNAQGIGKWQVSKKGIAKELLSEYNASLEKNYKEILDSLKLNDSK